MEVVDRIASSMIPKRAPSKYLSTLGLNPDLYGPFWTAVTLIFTIAVSGNLANYLQHANKDFHWHYNFHLVSSASICIMLYICLVPLAIWSVLKYSVSSSQENLEEEVCLHIYTILRALETYYHFSGELHTKFIITCMSLWIFFGSLHSSYCFVDNSSKIEKILKVMLKS